MGSKGGDIQRSSKDCPVRSRSAKPGLDSETGTVVGTLRKEGLVRWFSMSDMSGEMDVKGRVLLEEEPIRELMFQSIGTLLKEGCKRWVIFIRMKRNF